MGKRPKQQIMNELNQNPFDGMSHREIDVELHAHADGKNGKTVTHIDLGAPPSTMATVEGAYFCTWHADTETNQLVRTLHLIPRHLIPGNVKVTKKD